MQNFLTRAAVSTDDAGNLLGAYRSSRVSYIDRADIAACAEALPTVVGRRTHHADLSSEELAGTLAARGAPTTWPPCSRT